MKTLIEKYYLVPLVLLCGVYAYLAVDFPVHDFANYYFSGKFLAEGHFSSWIYFPYEFNQAIAAEGHPNIFASYAPNTPFLALVFLPLSFLSIGTAKLLFNLISILLFVFTLRRLVKFYRIKPEYVLAIPFVFYIPIRNELLFGQVYFLLFFLLGETWLAYKRNETIKTAILIASAILLKVFPALLLLAFLFRKKYELLGYIGGCCVVLFSLSAVFGGVDIWVFFLENVLPKAASGEISESFVPNYQSVFMFFKQLLVFEKTQNPYPFFDYPVLFATLMMAFKIKLIALGYYITIKVKLPLVAFSYWILAMILWSPYGSTYTFILLLFPFLALALNKISEWKKIVGLALIFIICNVPLSQILKWHFPFNFVRLFALLSLFTLIVFLVLRTIRIGKVTLAILIPTLLFFLVQKHNPSNSDHVLDRHAPILIHDYTVKSNAIDYSYFDENGHRVATTAFDGTHAEPAIIHQNQVFYNGAQLTFDPSNKRKPLVIDGKMLVYLSDYDRGIGFYTLRKIELK